jgi:hypothetical protein
VTPANSGRDVGSDAASTATHVILDHLTPAAEDAWRVLFDLTVRETEHLVLVGGQRMYLLAERYQLVQARPTDDLDVVVDLRAKPGGTRWVADWLVAHGFEMDQPSSDGIGHRFSRPADPGPGKVLIDVLAPEKMGENADLLTRPPARTVEAPGTRQAFERSELVTVTVSGYTSRPARTGQVRCPTVLGALIAKAAATKELTVRTNPERDWHDAARALVMLPDPYTARADLKTKADRRRIRNLAPLLDEAHPAWSGLTRRQRMTGITALQLLLR